MWHGVELCRGLVLGGLGATEALAHLAVLVAFVVGGWSACQVTFRQAAATVSATLTRVVPSALFDVRNPQRLLERSVMVYRRTWLIFVSGFFEPLFYLLSIRVGLSALVGDIDGRRPTRALRPVRRPGPARRRRR